MPFHNLPILADANAIVVGLIVLFTVLGWIVKGIQALNEKPPAMGGRQAQAGRPRDPGLQDEIDDFLEDVLGKEQVDAARLERRRRESQSRRRQPAKSQSSAKKSPPKPAPAPQKSTAQESRRVGGNVAAHVQTYMEPKLENVRTSQFAPLSSSVGEHVSQHLGVSGAGSEQLPAGSAAGLLSGVLASPDSIRQAILINEILSPPLSLRGRAQPD